MIVKSALVTAALWSALVLTVSVAVPVAAFGFVTPSTATKIEAPAAIEQLPPLSVSVTVRFATRTRTLR